MLFHLNITTIFNVLIFITIRNSAEYYNLLLFIKLHNLHATGRLYHARVNGIE
jgi:hypothetical protein